MPVFNLEGELTSREKPKHRAAAYINYFERRSPHRNLRSGANDPERQEIFTKKRHIPGPNYNLGFSTESPFTFQSRRRVAAPVMQQDDIRSVDGCNLQNRSCVTPLRNFTSLSTMAGAPDHSTDRPASLKQIDHRARGEESKHPRRGDPIRANHCHLFGSGVFKKSSFTEQGGGLEDDLVFSHKGGGVKPFSTHDDLLTAAPLMSFSDDPGSISMTCSTSASSPAVMATAKPTTGQHRRVAHDGSCSCASIPLDN